MELGWVPVLAAGAILVSLAALLAWRGFRNLPTWMTVLLVLAFGGLGMLAGYIGDRPVTALYRPGRWFIQAVGLGALFALVATWPSYPAVGWRRLVSLAGLIPPILALGPLFEFIYAIDTPITTTHIAHVSNWSQPILLAIVAVPYLRLRAGTLRSQLFYLLLFLLTWNTFGGLHLVLSGGPTLYVAAGGAQLAAVTLLLLATGMNVWRNWEFKSRPQDIVVLGWTLGVAAVAAIPATGNVRSFYLINALALMLLFYGIARYQVLNVDLRFPSITGRSFRGAIVVPTFFVLLQVVEVESQRILGTNSTMAGLALGSILSGVLLFFLSRIQTALAAGQDMPRAHEPLDSHDAYRRIEMYRAAMEAVYADGLLSPKEERMVRRLRAALGITREEHMAIEREALSERAKRLVALG